MDGAGDDGLRRRLGLVRHRCSRTLPVQLSPGAISFVLTRNGRRDDVELIQRELFSVFTSTCIG